MSQLLLSSLDARSLVMSSSLKLLLHAARYLQHTHAHAFTHEKSAVEVGVGALHVHVWFNFSVAR